MDHLLATLKWMGFSLLGVFVVYLVGRILFAAIFRSWYDAKIDYFKRRKQDASTTDKTRH